MLRKMIGIYGRVFSFFPQSFILPKDKDRFAEFYMAEKAAEADGKSAAPPNTQPPHPHIHTPSIYPYRTPPPLLLSTRALAC